jgi:hypothetical protein
MSNAVRTRSDASADWPAFGLRYTFNPDDVVDCRPFAPDELVVFDPAEGDSASGSWIAAERGSYVSIEDTR